MAPRAVEAEKRGRVVDLANKNQAAKPWWKAIFRSIVVPSVADCFRTCFGDKSATLNVFLPFRFEQTRFSEAVDSSGSPQGGR